ncbi:type ISP restriction/modification enzyme [Microbacterium sp. NPDC057650]|uniref:type ISP restriction/modification enzyme n=1 Tax=unclassified Microbacterium TaxID=2609290 RepID=UPI00367079C1
MGEARLESESLDALLAEFRELADSKRMAGNYLEQLARHYLTVEPLWADQLGAVWLWRDWPGRDGKPDTGIDLVAEIQGGGLLAVQVKFFAETHRMQKGDLDSFFEAMGKEPFTEGLVIDTTSAPWSANAEEALKNRTKPVRRVSLAELRHSSIDWSTYELLKPEVAPERHALKTLRAHQHEAVHAVMEGLDPAGEQHRGKLIMACGTGKTFTALKLAERWTNEYAGGASTVLFMVPSLALLQQSLDEWSRERDPELGFRAFAVGSDSNIGRRKNDDLTSVLMEDLGAPATTDGKALAKLLGDVDEEHEGLTVVFSTYQSIDAVAEAQRLRGDTFDLVICDEAHRTTGVTLADESESHFVKVHDNNVIPATARVYMTATPRIFAPEVKNAASQKSAELVSMDDEELFGRVLYRIGFDEAVRKGLLTDYKVVVLGISEDEIVESLQQELAHEGRELAVTDVAKLIGCWNALAKRNAGTIAEGFGVDAAPMRRAVAFAKDIKTSQGVAGDFTALVEGHLSNIENEDKTDDLTIEAQHVDGTMNATQRGELLDWLKAAPEEDQYGRPVARVLTNARCLSEGVDVPSLDAVLFLSPRKSQVDVVQAVGRVMRRSPEKKLGYILLPIAIPAGIAPEEALNDNERYKVVWQVLQALRAHDERLDAAINQAAFTGKLPEQVLIERVSLTSTKKREGSAFDAPVDKGPGDESGSGPSHLAPTLPGLTSTADAWKDSVYAKLVAKVGDRMYWDDWAGDIAEIAQRFIALIAAHVNAPENDRSPFENFVNALRATVNPDVSEAEAIELLAQHLITKPVFEAMFPEESFTQDNPVSTAMEHVLETFHENTAFAREREPLDAFYSRVTGRIRGLDTVSAKQQMLVTLYDKFFTKAFPLLADRMGIVFTPVEVVDYILRSADAVYFQHFGRHLSDEGVNILEPFAGTGTFLTRLMQTGLIKPEDLTRKYTQELFANEIVLLSYYIAAVNIESVYRELCAEHGFEPAEGGFAGISLTDTFAMDERDSQLAGGVFPENTARLEKQRAAKVDVIVMNPPYRAGQASANDGAQNAKYKIMDDRIAETYAKRSSAANKNGLYDSYYRALRWAADRLGDEGVIAFVSNSGFIDGGTADGVRLSWGDEFSDVIVYNLRGNQRVKNWQAEGGKVFGEGSQTGIAITILVKDEAPVGPVRVHYADIGDYLSREEKLDRLRLDRSLDGTSFQTLVPNDAGDWINQRDDRYGIWQPIGDKATKGQPTTTGVFRDYSLGIDTKRDAWVLSFSASDVTRNGRKSIDEFNELVDDGTRPVDSARIAWSRKMESRRRSGKRLEVAIPPTRIAAYRPFLKQHVWFDRQLIDLPGISERAWPASAHSNLAIAVGSDARNKTLPMLVSTIPSLDFSGASQLFPRYTWEPASAPDGALNLEALAASDSDEVVDGYRRVDNITDATLDTYRKVQGDDVTKDDIFYGIYALLHHPTYRETYAADLQKMLPRIPQVKGFLEYARIGRALAALHVDYESVKQADLGETITSIDPPADPYELYRIEKLSWLSRKDHTAIRYNASLTITGIPEDEALYKVGGRSPLEWVVDRYQVKTDKASGIVNDPNAWLREQENPRYVVDLIRSLVTVSLETQRLIAELPPFEVIE